MYSREVRVLGAPLSVQAAHVAGGARVAGAARLTRRPARSSLVKRQPVVVERYLRTVRSNIAGPRRQGADSVLASGIRTRWVNQRHAEVHVMRVRLRCQIHHGSWLRRLTDSPELGDVTASVLDQLLEEGAEGAVVDVEEHIAAQLATRCALVKPLAR